MAYKYYKDNRSFIDACVKTGDAVVVNEEVDWDLEMGAIVRRVRLFFSKISRIILVLSVLAHLSQPTEDWQSRSVWIRTARFLRFPPNT
jgi:hypothetical protein